VDPTLLHYSSGGQARLEQVRVDSIKAKAPRDGGALALVDYLRFHWNQIVKEMVEWREFSTQKEMLL